MKNIHVLPTDKPSRLSIIDSQLIYSKEYFINAQNIYITSDEEIKEGDWYISILENEVYKATKETQNIMSVANLVASTSYKKTHFKIILTTDQDLIKDGVQSIDDEFLDWFVKNPSCESVEVEIVEFGYDEKPICEYKIIIPKEEVLLQSSIDGEPIWGEAPKQETLEEFINSQPYYGSCTTEYLEGIEVGAKWQQEQDKNKYSDEEVKDYAEYYNAVANPKTVKDYFKNK